MSQRKARPKRITLRDVARKSGFSPSTVSIVLSDAPLSRYVAADTKEHIRKVAKELGYKPDVFARSLRSRRSNTIGVLLFDISDPYCLLILRGIEKTLRGTSWLPILVDAHNDHTRLQSFLDLFIERRVEGLIVVANWLFDEAGMLGRITQEEMPVIVVGRDLSARNIRSVLVDNEAGGYEAARHLHKLGHSKIAIIRGPQQLTDSIRRWEGMERYASQSGWEIDPRLVRELPVTDDPVSPFEGGVRVTTDLLDSGEPFTALIAFDDFTALGALRALNHAGRSAPRDCSVLGFDDMPQASFSTPALSTVRQPMVEMGATAAQRVLNALGEAGKNDPLVEMFAPELVLRDSTARLD
ncbi:MAG TPA: LacI family DNA-binding transcriptional regulator [Acidobacteriaceae bacterium]|nr:LacI family DNA-binding transcriptional regulator [Acidobacteriaceae bacterium]